MNASLEVDFEDRYHKKRSGDSMVNGANDFKMRISYKNDGNDSVQDIENYLNNLEDHDKRK